MDSRNRSRDLPEDDELFDQIRRYADAIGTRRDGGAGHRPIASVTVDELQTRRRPVMPAVAAALVVAASLVALAFGLRVLTGGDGTTVDSADEAVDDDRADHQDGADATD